MINQVVFRGTREDITKTVALLGAILAGREPDRHDIGRGFLMAIGFAALSDIKDAYVLKARGGTDAMGVKWPKLSAKYLAYGRRFGPTEQSRLKTGAGLGRSHRLAPGGKKGLLTAAELKQWRRIYSQRLRRYMLSEGESAAKSHAAAVAWVIMKSRGARTKLEVFGNRQVQILRDTGILLNSLSPGQLSTGAGSVSYSMPSGPGGTEQIFKTNPGEVIVGTNVAYASRHQRGGGGVPARVFIPDENHAVPEVWWARWAKIANQALAVSVGLLFRTATP